MLSYGCPAAERLLGFFVLDGGMAVAPVECNHFIRPPGVAPGPSKSTAWRSTVKLRPAATPPPMIWVKGVYKAKTTQTSRNLFVTNSLSIAETKFPTLGPKSRPVSTM